MNRQVFVRAALPMVATVGFAISATVVAARPTTGMQNGTTIEATVAPGNNFDQPASWAISKRRQPKRRAIAQQLDIQPRGWPAQRTARAWQGILTERPI